MKVERVFIGERKPRTDGLRRAVNSAKYAESRVLFLEAHIVTLDAEIEKLKARLFSIGRLTRGLKK